jgi:hypothetical protein
MSANSSWRRPWPAGDRLLAAGDVGEFKLRTPLAPAAMSANSSWGHLAPPAMSANSNCRRFCRHRQYRRIQVAVVGCAARDVGEFKLSSSASLSAPWPSAVVDTLVVESHRQRTSHFSELTVPMPRDGARVVGRGRCRRIQVEDAVGPGGDVGEFKLSSSASLSAPWPSAVVDTLVVESHRQRTSHFSELTVPIPRDGARVVGPGDVGEFKLRTPLAPRRCRRIQVVVVSEFERAVALGGRRYVGGRVTPAAHEPLFRAHGTDATRWRTGCWARAMSANSS